MLPFDTFYRRAAIYRNHRPPESHQQLREGTASGGEYLYTERHLQCVWYDPLYRPEKLHTTEGEQVTVLYPGRWNLEAGPDFLDATLLVGPQRRRLQGDVEIHVRPEDWQHHGHSRDSRYDAVALHVTYWPSGNTNIELPPGALHVSLKASLDLAPAFHFECIDTSAYPYAVPPRHGATAEPVLIDATPDMHIALLESAGQERLRQKTEHMALSIHQWGPQQSLYEWVMGALGYKQNRIAFRQLARRVTYLDMVACETPIDALGLLLGVSGLLPKSLRDRWDSDTKCFMRRLWDTWWKQQSRWQALALHPDTWNLAGIRPLNHPIRRMAAAASLFGKQSDLGQALLASDPANPEAWLQHTDAQLDPQSAFPYWTHRQGLSGVTRQSPVALIGKARRHTIISNVVIPFVAAHDMDISPLLPVLPAEASNQWIRDTANTLFGPDHNPAMYSHGLRQQGLIQIFHDFCLPNRTEVLRDLLGTTATTALR